MCIRDRYDRVAPGERAGDSGADDLCRSDREVGQHGRGAGPGPRVGLGGAVALGTARLALQPGVQGVLFAGEGVEAVIVAEDLGEVLAHARLNRRGLLAASSRRGTWSGISRESIRASNCSTGIRVTSARASTMSASRTAAAVSYTHLRAHETRHDLVCRL